MPSLSERRVIGALVASLVLVPFVFVILGESFVQFFNPLVFVLIYSLAARHMISPLFAHLDGKPDMESRARKAAIGLPWLILASNVGFWALGIIVFYGIAGWKAPNGMPFLQTSFLLDPSETSACAKFVRVSEVASTIWRSISFWARPSSLPRPASPMWRGASSCGQPMVWGRPAWASPSESLLRHNGPLPLPPRPFAEGAKSPDRPSLRAPCCTSRRRRRRSQRKPRTPRLRQGRTGDG
jgi:hypothetical protein